ncbi:MAG TPA: chromate transporter, partial [Chthoniobacterales bacterium]
AKKALTSAGFAAIALAAFVAIFAFKVSFLLILLAAALAGVILGRPASPHPAPPLEERPAHSARVIAGGLLLWWAPILLAGLIFGWGSLYFQQGLFFSKTALITFGGAYAVLPYVAQQAVEQFGWLQTNQMIAGLALAETTPGPLIMVLQFIGFLAAWQQPGGLPPLLAGTLGAAITTWATFLPSFLLVFLGAPFVERLRQAPRLKAALAGITAAVVGVILNLAVWFGWHIAFPGGRGFDAAALIFSGLFFAGIQWRKWSTPTVVAAGALIGLIRFWI